MLKFKKYLMYSLGVLIILLAISWFFRFEIGGLVLSKLYQPKQKYLSLSPEQNLTRMQKWIDEDAELLSKNSFFMKDSGGTKDASAFLNPLVSWNKIDDFPGVKGKLLLPEELNQLLTSSQNFTQLKIQWKKMNLDFSWLTELQKYDHWSYDQSGPAYDESKEYKIIVAPTPEYSELQSWSKLRLLLGRDRGDLTAAFREVRQLAQLVMTHETLLSSMVAIAIMGLESKMYKELDKKSQSQIDSKDLISLDLHYRARRFYFAVSSFTDLRLTPEVFKHFNSYKVGACHKIQEGIFNNIAYRRILIKEYPEEYARLNQQIQESAKKCRTSFLRKMWKKPSYDGLFTRDEDIFQTVDHFVREGSENPITKEPLIKTTFADLEKHPVVANLMVYTLLSISQPNFLKLYLKEIKQ